MKYTVTNVNEEVDLRLSESDTILPYTIVQQLKMSADLYGNRDALCYKEANIWKSYTWSDYYNISRKIANGFIKLGLEPGDGVAILGFNTPEWFLVNMAAIMAGAVSVGIYTTNSASICEYIVKDANCKIIVVENDMQLQKVMPLYEAAGIKGVIQYLGKLETAAKDQDQDQDQEKEDDGFVIVPRDDNNLFDWPSFMEYIDIDENDQTILDNRISALKANKCSTLIYTSGTTGLPKGVMLSHDNILWTTKSALSSLNLTPDNREKVVSYLPLSHVAAQMMDIYMPIVNAGTTYFADSDALRGSLGNTLKEVKPTIFLGVPRVWSKIMEKMVAMGKQNSGFKQMVARSAKKVGFKKHMKAEAGQPNWSSFKYRLFEKLVFTKVKAALGFENCRYFFTGAAPIDIEVLDYFASLSIPILELYGMSECTGPMTVSVPNAFLTGSVGKPVTGTALLLKPVNNQEEGSPKEVCCYGRHVMMGYLNNQGKTDEVVDKDGFLHSEDEGAFDTNGYLYITGRIKDLIITEGGENIPPLVIEHDVLQQLPDVLSNCLIVGDKRKYLTCLVTLKCETDATGLVTDTLVTELQSKFGGITTVTAAMSDQNVKSYIQEGINRANKGSISNAHTVKYFRILPKDFSVAGGELGPTLKTKRNVVLSMYKDMIEEMYSAT